MRRAPARNIPLKRRISDAEDADMTTVSRQAARVQIVDIVPQFPRAETIIGVKSTRKLGVYWGASEGWTWYSPDA